MLSSLIELLQCRELYSRASITVLLVPNLTVFFSTKQDSMSLFLYCKATKSKQVKLETSCIVKFPYVDCSQTLQVRPPFVSVLLLLYLYHSMDRYVSLLPHRNTCPYESVLSTSVLQSFTVLVPYPYVSVLWSVIRAKDVHRRDILTRLRSNHASVVNVSKIIHSRVGLVFTLWILHQGSTTLSIKKNR